MTIEEKELWIDRVNTAMRVERNATIDRVLEVIDEMERDTNYVFVIVDGKANGVLCNSRDVRYRILALKGGEQE